MPRGVAASRSLARSSASRRGAAALLCLVFVGCATLAPGADPVVVRAEQTLAGGDALYGDAMAYYFTPGVAASLAPGATKVFEAVRTGFDPAYKDVQKALDAYKAVKALVEAGQANNLAASLASLQRASNKLAALVNQVLSQLPAAAQKKSGGKPVGGV
jgi:hypothetical protein